MRTIAYLSNRFPTAVEPYVVEEIMELRRRGVMVIPCSAQRSFETEAELEVWTAQTLHILPLHPGSCVCAAKLGLRNLDSLSDIFDRILFRGRESPYRRLKALVHTFLGIYFAVLLENTGVDHIHVHHGYFACWIAMVAARLHGITYSATLHGSDLLMHKAYLDTKLANCEFCATVSEFNREYMLDHIPGIDSKKVFVRRMGVDTANFAMKDFAFEVPPQAPLRMLAVGRLHPVKNYEFLIEACARLKHAGHAFVCHIAGEGNQRSTLKRRIQKLRLESDVILDGHLVRAELDAMYADSNLIVLTSHSEGLPLVLMEAMARGKVILAPAITGIPELVTDGWNGFLFRPGSSDDFILKLEMICSSSADFVSSIRLAAKKTILEHFDRNINVAAFVDLLIHSTARKEEAHEDLVLQQI